jgi:hypothetical protein
MGAMVGSTSSFDATFKQSVDEHANIEHFLSRKVKILEYDFNS